MGAQRVKVGSTTEFDGKDYGMKAMKFGDSDQEVLVTKVNGQYNAIASKCSHYGAPLASMFFVLCEWHPADC